MHEHVARRTRRAHHRREPGARARDRARLRRGRRQRACSARATRRCSSAARDELAALARPGQRVAGDARRRLDAGRRRRAGRRGARRASRSSHVLVNNAGVYGPMGRIDEVDWDDWVAGDRDQPARHRCCRCRALLPHFKQQRYGKIVQLSGGGATNPLPRISAYAASKAAIVRFAETLALEVTDDRHRRQRDRAGRAQHAPARRAARRRARARSAQAFYERMKKTAEERRHAARDAARRWPSSSARPASDGITGRLLSARRGIRGHDLPAHRDDLDAPTSTRCAASSRGPRHGLGRQVSLRRRDRRLRPDRPQARGGARRRAPGRLRRPRPRAGRGAGGDAPTAPAPPTIAVRTRSTRPDVDIVIVATTNDALARSRWRRVEAGKHVLVEKPAGAHRRRARRRARRRRARAARRVRVGFNHRYHPALRRRASSSTAARSAR